MARVILAIDPGPVRSAWLVYAPELERPETFAIETNEELLARLHAVRPAVGAVVIEKVESFGMSVGAEVFETVFWSGRFAEAVLSRPSPPALVRLGRMAVKFHLCQTAKAKDANIRQALIDRFGGASAIGRKAKPGPLYGVAHDVWSALAIAVTHADQVAA